MRNVLKFLLSLSLLVSLSSCTPKPPDVFVCKALNQRISSDPKTNHMMLLASPSCVREIDEPECGYCLRILSKQVKYVGEKDAHKLDGKPWSQIKREAVIVPAESYAGLSAFMINSCKAQSCLEQINDFRILFQ